MFAGSSIVKFVYKSQEDEDEAKSGVSNFEVSK